MRFKVLSLAVLLASLPALAEEGDAKWTLDVRELSLSYSNTTVSNSREYKNSPVSAYSADSQYNIVGKLDTFLNRSSDTGIWENNLMLLKYAKHLELVLMN